MNELINETLVNFDFYNALKKMNYFNEKNYFASVIM
jgi:hypothetical protein